MLKGKPGFIISLDFELMWGVRDKKTVESYGANIMGVREVIPALLDLFSEYGIHATFATVGFLFARSKEELKEYIPGILPDYPLEKYSPYKNNYIQNIGNSEEDDIYHYAGSLIELIQQYPEQEIASHTFSHYYCLENASPASFEADLLAAKNIAAIYNVDLKSIVFPRNQYSQIHIDICKKSGFTSYRGNESSYLYRPRKNEEHDKKVKALRLIDSYANISGHHCFDLSYKEKEEIINIPASRFLRPYSPKLKWFNPVRISRIKNSLTYAAQHGQWYHLWWHPHNFGSNLDENLATLKEILDHYKHLSSEYGIRSSSMKEIAEEIIFENAQ
jgi:peptidoglycan/xylan/chitin deacetylase (PgdA/CDA1 family)